jgi:hypothetical protein
MMNIRQTTMSACLAVAVFLACATRAQAQAGAETFTATATVKTAGGAEATAPVTMTIDRKMPEAESDKLVAAFKSGGPAGLRKALAGVPATGSVQLADGAPTPALITIERPTDSGRLIIIVTDTPLLFLGAGVPGAKLKDGYDVAVIDLEIDASGDGSGTLAPAAKVTVSGSAFVVEDYASELVRLAGVKKVK